MNPPGIRKKGDRGVVMCFDEKSGEFVWQLVIPKLGAGKVSDWEYIEFAHRRLLRMDWPMW